jgi:N-acetylglutamate synthase-like GNAT family acetyltransferase
MPAFQLRRATAADQPVIKSLISAVQINPMGLKWQNFIVAVDEADSLIGCGQVKRHRDDSRELASIAVAREWRKQGIARAIIQRLLAETPPPLWLTCISRLVPFYQKFGFVEVTNTADMPPYFGRAQRLFRLFLRLSRREGYLAVMVWGRET